MNYSVNFTSMKKYLIIAGVLLLLGLLLFIPKSCNRSVIPSTNTGWETLKKQNELELAKKDSIYFDLKKKTDLRMSQLEKEKIAQEKKYQKQLKDLKKKYDKEYSKVTATPIDSTINISTRFLSEEVDYSKFQK